MDNVTVMTLEEVARAFKVHISTIYRLLRRKELPGFKVGRDWRFSVESVNAWLKRQEAAVRNGHANNQSDG